MNGNDRRVERRSAGWKRGNNATVNAMERWNGKRFNLILTSTVSEQWDRGRAVGLRLVHVACMWRESAMGLWRPGMCCAEMVKCCCAAMR